jgi:DNA-binding XRE family transcriptional regulator
VVSRAGLAGSGAPNKDTYRPPLTHSSWTNIFGGWYECVSYNTHRLWTHRLYLAIHHGMSKSDRGRFGKKIRELRLAKNLTQEELATCAGLHPTYVGGVERGERNIGFDNVLKLARALEKLPAALFADFTE